jgi:hypothetical protein
MLAHLRNYQVVAQDQAACLEPGQFFVFADGFAEPTLQRARIAYSMPDGWSRIVTHAGLHFTASPHTRLRRFSGPWWDIVGVLFDSAVAFAAQPGCARAHADMLARYQAAADVPDAWTALPAEALRHCQTQNKPRNAPRNSGADNRPAPACSA